MKLIIGGTISIILGFSGFALYFSDFINIMEGILPLVFIAGGIIVIILKREENAFEPTDSEDSSTPTIEPMTIEPEEPKDEEPAPAVIESIETRTIDVQPVEAGSNDRTPDKNIEPTTGFVGNESSHVFHTQDCKYSASKKCTASFTSRAAAIEKGYKPCSVCKP
ncbi:MAG: Ada metal-binding domain-containing protein [Pseudomonadota bacterium]